MKQLEKFTETTCIILIAQFQIAILNCLPLELFNNTRSQAGALFVIDYYRVICNPLLETK